MKNLLTLLLASAAWMGTGAIALADQRPVIITELFTSQGCNSCPPADAYMSELKKRDDVLPLSFNVDYWDYLGWKDTLGRKEWTDRQRAYHKSLHNGVYTPQLVIGGTVDVVGSDRNRANQLIKEWASHAPQVELTADSQGLPGPIKISIGALAKAPASGLWLVRYDPEEIVPIGRGENGGRTITYHNVVRSLTLLGPYKGMATQIIVPAEALQGNQKAVVMLQTEGNGPILGALRLGSDKSAALR